MLIAISTTSRQPDSPPTDQHRFDAEVSISISRSSLALRHVESPATLYGSI
jgi:hypothetical protein